MISGDCAICFHARATLQRAELIRNDAVPVVIQVCKRCNDMLEMESY